MQVEDSRTCRLACLLFPGAMERVRASCLCRAPLFLCVDLASDETSFFFLESSDSTLPSSFTPVSRSTLLQSVTSHPQPPTRRLIYLAIGHQEKADSGETPTPFQIVWKLKVIGKGVRVMNEHLADSMLCRLY